MTVLHECATCLYSQRDSGIEPCKSCRAWLEWTPKPTTPDPTTITCHRTLYPTPRPCIGSRCSLWVASLTGSDRGLCADNLDAKPWPDHDHTTDKEPAS